MKEAARRKKRRRRVGRKEGEGGEVARALKREKDWVEEPAKAVKRGGQMRRLAWRKKEVARERAAREDQEGRPAGDTAGWRETVHGGRLLSPQIPAPSFQEC